MTADVVHLWDLTASENEQKSSKCVCMCEREKVCVSDVSLYLCLCGERGRERERERVCECTDKICSFAFYTLTNSESLSCVRKGGGGDEIDG